MGVLSPTVFAREWRGDTVCVQCKWQKKKKGNASYYAHTATQKLIVESKIAAVGLHKSVSA